jgi:hypothetical protein
LLAYVFGKTKKEKKILIYFFNNINNNNLKKEEIFFFLFLMTAKSSTRTTGVPAAGFLYPDNYDGEATYHIILNLWWGNNANKWTLFENGIEISTIAVVENSPNPQTGRIPITNRPNGSYVYTGVISNSFGSTACQPLTVTVRRGQPASTLPGAPTNLTAAAKSSNQIDVTWSPVTGATSYNALINKNLVHNVTSPYSITGLSPSTTVTVALQSVNALGTSAFTSEIKATTLPASSNLPLPPAGLIVTATSETTAIIAWNAAAAATEYDLLIDDTFYNASRSPFLASGLRPGKTYTIKVRSENAAGPSEYSEPVTLTMAGSETSPGVPANVQASPVSQTQINVTWSNNNNNESSTDSVSGIAYDIVIDENMDTGIVYGVNSPFASSGLQVGSTHSYRVRARSLQNITLAPSAWSALVSATTFTVVTIPSTPTNLTATALSTSSIRVSWSPVNNAVSYSLQIDGKLISPNVTTTSYTVNSLAADSTHTFAVAATNGAGTSPFTNTISLTTPKATLPAIPTGLALTVNSSAQITVVWLGAANATTYDLEKNGTILISSRTPFVDIGLKGQTTYTYRVRGTNAYGSSEWSTAVSGTTPAAAVNPPLSVGEVANPSGRYYLGYFPSWSAPYYTTVNSDGTPMSDNQVYAVSSLAQLPGVYTHINLSFGLPSFAWGGLQSNSWAGTGIEFSMKPTDVLRSIRILHTLKKKVYLSIGGASYGNWDALAGEASLAQPGPISSALTRFINDMELDGLDVDCEAGQSASASTVNFYVNCITVMKAAVDASNGLKGAKELSIAAWSTGSDYIAGMNNQPGWPGVASYWGGAAGRERLTFQKVITAAGPYLNKTVGSLFSHVNVMSYDAQTLHYDPTVAYNQYRTLVPSTTAVLSGVETPPEGWPGGVCVIENSHASTSIAGTTIAQNQYGTTLNAPYSFARTVGNVLNSTVNPHDGAFIWSTDLINSVPVGSNQSLNAKSAAQKAASLFGYVPKPPTSI